MIFGFRGNVDRARRDRQRLIVSPVIRTTQRVGVAVTPSQTRAGFSRIQLGLGEAGGKPDTEATGSQCAGDTMPEGASPLG